MSEKFDGKTKHYFNTGVKPWSGAGLWGEFQVWRKGEKHIVFYLEHEPPEGSVFKFAAPKNDLPESKYLEVIKIVGGGLCSEYAYYSVPKEAKDGLH